MPLTFTFCNCRILSSFTFVEIGKRIKMKKLPDSELELMMIIWHAQKPITRMEIEEGLPDDRKISATAILSFLTRLEERGFLEIEKRGKLNVYTPIIKESEYTRKESKSILQKMYHNSVKSFMTALYDGDNLSEDDIKELQNFIDEKRLDK